MQRIRNFLCHAMPWELAFYVAFAISAHASASESTKTIRIGIVGLDTPHASEFARILNDPQASPELAGCRVVVAVDAHSSDNSESVGYHTSVVRSVEKLGIEIVPSVPAILSRVDAVMIESIDGRPHLDQVAPVLKAGIPVFVDKPVANSLVDVVVIYELARYYEVPIFSSSALRFAKGNAQRVSDPVGSITGCDTYSPAPLEPHHSRLFWYGIHGVEMLYTAMGVGCESVCCVSTDVTDVAVRRWRDGRVGTFRGRRKPGNGYAAGYGGTVFGDKSNRQLGDFSGYEPLVLEIARFFRDRPPPVKPEETIEIYTFMQAAEESWRLGGAPVTLEVVLKQARQEAAEKLKKMGVPAP